MVSKRVLKTYAVRFGPARQEPVSLRAAIDVHVHASGAPGSRDAPLEVARAATELGMAALLFKTVSGGAPWDVVQDLQSRVDEWAQRQGLQPVRCLSAKILGVPPQPVNAKDAQIAIQNGVSAIWLPPVTSAWSLSRIGGRSGWLGLEGPSRSVPPLAWDEACRHGVYVLDPNGKLLPDVRDVIHLCHDSGAALSLGHLSKTEMNAVSEECQKIGFRTFFIDHPFNEVFDLSIDDLRHYVAGGARLNLTWDELSPLLGVEPQTMIDAVRTLGAEAFLLSSDTGSGLLPAPTAAYKSLVDTLSGYGLGDEALKKMMVDNPAELLAAALI